MEDIETRYKNSVAARDKIIQSKVKIEAALSERKKNLREAMEKCIELGYNPDTLEEDIKKLEEIILVKLSVFESDLNTAKDMLDPMLKEIE